MSPLPDRFRASRVQVVPDAMPREFLTAAGRWLFEHRAEFTRLGDDEGTDQFAFAHERLDVANPDLAATVRKRVHDELPVTCATLGIEPFAVRRITVAALLLHHAGHVDWTDYAALPHVRLGFALFTHTEPKMFSGGQVEFVDGVVVEPKNNRLVLFDPAVLHRQRPVECWSAHVLHGRWALVGFVEAIPGEGIEQGGANQSPSVEPPTASGVG